MGPKDLIVFVLWAVMHPSTRMYDDEWVGILSSAAMQKNMPSNTEEYTMGRHANLYEQDAKWKLLEKMWLHFYVMSLAGSNNCADLAWLLADEWWSTHSAKSRMMLARQEPKMTDVENDHLQHVESLLLPRGHG